MNEMKIKVDYILGSLKAIHTQSQRILVDISGEYCSLFNNFSPIVKFIIEWINKSQNSSFHSCPYLPGEKFGVVNLNVNQLVNSVLNFFPKFINIGPGDYVITINTKDRTGKMIYHFKISLTISQKRPNKKN
jgi:hypothetical protein